MNRQPSILLIEDNEGDIELIKEAFINQAIRENLVVCANGELAISYLTETVIHSESVPLLILLDINLPKIDGKEVLSFLKHDERFKKIPVLILSSSALSKDIAFAYDNYANSYIVKPSNLVDFTRTIRSIEMFWIDCVTYPNFS